MGVGMCDGCVLNIAHRRAHARYSQHEPITLLNYAYGVITAASHSVSPWLILALVLDRPNTEWESKVNAYAQVAADTHSRAA